MRRLTIAGTCYRRVAINHTAIQSDFIMFTFIKWLKEKTWFTKIPFIPCELENSIICFLRTKSKSSETKLFKRKWMAIYMQKYCTTTSIIFNMLAWIRASRTCLSNFTAPNNLRRIKRPKNMRNICTCLVNSSAEPSMHVS